MKRFPGFLCVGVSVLASGCGGGGGGGDSSAPVTYAEITSDNAQLIASEVVSTTVSLESVGGGDVLGNSAADVSGDTVARAAVAGMKKRLYQGPEPMPAAITVPPQTDDCLMDGDVTSSGTVASTETLTSGDQMRLDFNDCDDGDGVVLDGRIDLHVRAFEGDVFDLFMLDVDTTVTNFSATASGETVVVGDGEARVVMDTMSYPLSTGSMSGSLITLRWDGATRTLRSYSTEFTSDESAIPASFTQDHRGTLSSTLFEGRVDYDTTSILQGAGDGPPVSGELLITGKDGATILLTVLDAANLRLDLDLDGDAVVDETQNATWDSLRP